MDVRLDITYKTPKGLETTFSSADMRVEEAIAIAGDLERTGRLKNITFVDHREQTWTLKQLKKLVAEIETEPHHITVYFDGGFDLQTKVSGLGCAIYYEQNGKSFRLRKNAKMEALDSNNEAEYAALHLAVQELEELGAHHLPVTFTGDSQVVINQLSGEWPTMEKALNSWADRIEDKLKKLGIDPAYEVVSRKKNHEADHLASQALNGVAVRSKVELDGKSK
ncbi:ribonuclease H family protein [Alteribacter keqinensis]|uniref:Reverse transcriptase-like protein n=1 Tax=Alteribacter keqinensis TaxID=2483800 RepID=A0A3M7TPF1_9BACI|nr:ribonuclease H family protein [Alteribacter keqinensis]RNA67124.1 reverse transcriptase-like protein [Alteribacter keqinensis]